MFQSMFLLTNILNCYIKKYYLAVILKSFKRFPEYIIFENCIDIFLEYVLHITCTQIFDKSSIF